MTRSDRADDGEEGNLRLCLLSGWAFFPMYLVGIVLVAGFIPPPSPSLSGEEIKALFDGNQQRILLAMSLCVIATALYVPWSVGLHGVMAKIEGGSKPLALTQLASGAVGAVFFLITPMMWATMAFRSSHDAGVLLILNDFAWISWIISWPPFLVQEFAFGIAIFRAKEQILPRWLAYYSLMGATTMLPATLILFFKSGPFAWTGIFGLFLPLVLFSIWFNVATYCSLRALKRNRLNSNVGEQSPTRLGQALGA